MKALVYKGPGKISVEEKPYPKQLITHQFELKDILEAYETFANAANQHVLKIILINR